MSASAAKVQSFKDNFIINLDVLEMKESDLGKKFNDGYGWCEFAGVKPGNWKYPLIYKRHNKYYKATVESVKKALGYEI